MFSTKNNDYYSDRIAQLQYKKEFFVHIDFLACDWGNLASVAESMK